LAKRDPCQVKASSLCERTFNGFVYGLSAATDKRSWANSEKVCKRWGGHLLSLESSGEYLSLDTQAGAEYWLGLKMGKTYSDETIVVYRPKIVELNTKEKQCAAIMDGPILNYDMCSREKQFICKKFTRPFITWWMVLILIVIFFAVGFYVYRYCQKKKQIEPSVICPGDTAKDKKVADEEAPTDRQIHQETSPQDHFSSNYDIPQKTLNSVENSDHK